MVGKNIKTLRKEKKLTLRSLAEKANISKSTLSDIENENTNPTVTTLNKIANALEVPLFLLTRKTVKDIIDDKLKEEDVTITYLARVTKIPMDYFDKLENIQRADDMDFEFLKIIAKELNIDFKIILDALFRQEPPAYDGPTTKAEEDFDAVPLSDEKIQLLNDFDKLNDIGKSKAKERIHELTLVPTYIIDKSHLMPIASHDKAGSFTEDDIKHDDDIMNNDDFWKK